MGEPRLSLRDPEYGRQIGGGEVKPFHVIDMGLVDFKGRLWPKKSIRSANAFTIGVNNILIPNGLHGMIESISLGQALGAGTNVVFGGITEGNDVFLFEIDGSLAPQFYQVKTLFTYFYVNPTVGITDELLVVGNWP